MKITAGEIEERIALAGPEKGGEWRAADVAAQLAMLIRDEVEEERAQLLAWEDGRKDFAVRFAGSDVRGGDAGRIQAARAEALALHGAAIRERVLARQEVFRQVSGVVVSAAAAVFSGGVTTPALIQQLMPVARVVVEALRKG